MTVLIDPSYFLFTRKKMKQQEKENKKQNTVGMRTHTGRKKGKGSK